MGSIPPAESIELDQREVVEVIGRANTRGYKDFSDTACAPPANTDLQQLRKAIEGFIRSNTFTDLIDTVVTFTVHGTSPDFPDLHAAMAYLMRYKIGATGKVILQLRGAGASGAATVYTYTKNVVFEHNNNSRIFVYGAPIRSAIPTDPTAYTLTGNDVTARGNNSAANLGMLRNKFATELHFTGGTNVQVQGECLGTFDALLITGDNSNAAGNPHDAGICWSAAGAALALKHFTDVRPADQGVAVVGFAGDGFYIGQGGNFTTYGLGFPLVSLGNGGSGFKVNAGGKFQPQYVCLSFSNGGSGFSTWYGGWTWFDTQNNAAIYNAEHGCECAEARANYQGVETWGNHLNGFQASSSSYIGAGGARVSNPANTISNDGFDAAAFTMSLIIVSGISGAKNLYTPALAAGSGTSSGANAGSNIVY